MATLYIFFKYGTLKKSLLNSLKFGWYILFVLETVAGWQVTLSPADQQTKWGFRKR